MERNRIIVGADANLTGLCPIMAASGSAQQVGRPFARAWDRYARARLPRAATERELVTLRSMLQTSIDGEQTLPPAFMGGVGDPEQVAQRRVDLTREGVARRRAAQAARRRQEAQDAGDAAREVRHALRDLRLGSRAPDDVVVAPAPESECDVRYSADYLRPAARVAAVKAEAKAKAQAEARAAAEANAKAQAEARAKAEASRRPVHSGEYDREWELASGGGGSWLRPFRRHDDYERALLDLERELEAVERRAGFDDGELVTSHPRQG
ncbi:MAG: hypothetical protein LC790_14830 [Actinobacteria bacterium]|nr:hypothetical protein [Actinomycetota bacterium]